MRKDYFRREKFALAWEEQVVIEKTSGDDGTNYVGFEAEIFSFCLKILPPKAGGLPRR